jgi:hypothetical protein
MTDPRKPPVDDPIVFEILRRYLDGEMEIDQAARSLAVARLGEDDGFGVDGVTPEEASRLVALFARLDAFVREAGEPDR